ncbi:hypothetical protein C8F01DRAFT_1236763 [Mycena amicta]|nr:hypothetical protein C8F01DRAFT_1236763 [Mycena amicta]
MHRSLQIPEIVLHVVLQVSSGSGRWRRTLAALARTSRLFEDAALDELWREPGPNTLAHIFKCFPEDLFQGAVGRNEKLSQRLMRAMVLSDWDRPRRYCKRVRVYSFRDISVDKDALSLLSIWLPNGYLFPRLERLTFNSSVSDDEAGSVNLLRPLLSPNLRNLVLASTSPIVLSILPAVMQRTLQLTTLHIRGPGGSARGAFDHSALSLFIRSLNRLQSLVIPALDFDALSHRAMHGSIKHLEIAVLSRETLPTLARPESWPTHSCLSLEHLRLGAVDIPTATRLLRLLSNAPLKRLIVNPSLHSGMTAETSAFYRGMVAHLNRSALRHFQHFTSENTRLERDALLSLGLFPGPTGVQISCAGTLDIDDGIVTSLALKWPSLTSLSLEQHDGSSRLTLSALASLAEHCKSLDSVDLTLDTTTIPPTPAISTRGELIMHTALKTLGAGRSSLESAFPVARSLSALFPELRTVYTGWDDSEMDLDVVQRAMRKRWDEVGDLVPQLTAVRAEGKQGAERSIP